MAVANHNIICLETEWLIREKKETNIFNLQTEPLLEWLHAYHNCSCIHRTALSKTDLQYYFDRFRENPSKYKKYDIFYFAFHGWDHSLCTELDDENLDLTDLAEMAGGLLEGKIVHFGSCRTMSNENEVLQFKERTGARLVSGYKISVDPMKSAIADIAYFNELMKLTERVGIITNRNRSSFWKIYGSLLDDLSFVAI